MSSNDDQLPRGAGGAREVPAVPAATVIVCRNDPFRVLMMLRHENSSFVPDAWVFPGGSLDDGDRAAAEQLALDVDDLAQRVCAIRELLEETGLWLGDGTVDATALRDALRRGDSTLREHAAAVAEAAQSLVLTSRWITPVGVPKRFDTWFFLAACSDDTTVTADLAEAVELRWVEPAEALRLHREGSFSMVFPTIRNLEAIRDFSRVDELLDSRRGAVITPTQPLLVSDGTRKKIVLPDER